MTGLVESTTDDDQSERALDRWRGVGWLACGLAGVAATVWFVFLGPGETGSKADWFFGAAVLCVVMVAMWQTGTVQRQANGRAADAAERLRVEIAAAEHRLQQERAAADERAERERELTQRLHRAELDSQSAAHRAEMTAHRRQAEAERRQLHSQLQKQAVVEVSRAVGVHTRMLAQLWHRGAEILRYEDRDERERAMSPIFEQIGQVVNDFSVELANAQQVVDDARLNQALEGVNEAVLMGIRVAQDVCDDVVAGRATGSNPIPPAQGVMYEKAAEARRLAWELLRSGLEREHSPGD